MEIDDDLRSLRKIFFPEQEEDGIPQPPDSAC